MQSFVLWMMDDDVIALTMLAIVSGYLFYSFTASVLDDPEPPEPMIHTNKGELNRRYDTDWFEKDE
jgi:hypothetical protein